MLGLDRRSLLIGGSSALATTAVPTVAQAAFLPVLWADGEHDDTKAIEALLTGGAVLHGGRVLTRELPVGRFKTQAGYLACTRPVRFDTCGHWEGGRWFAGRRDYPDAAVAAESRPEAPAA